MLTLACRATGSPQRANIGSPSRIPEQKPAEAGPQRAIVTASNDVGDGLAHKSSAVEDSMD